MRVSQKELSEKLSLMREVSLTMHYSVHDHAEVISPNFISFPTKTDIIDKAQLETMRGLWLEALSRPQETIKAVPAKETTADRILNVVQATLNHKGIEEAFVKAAAYPVPAAYVVHLPVYPKDLRLEIIHCLVPFEETRAMLKRLEDKLEAPMRVLQIGHSGVSSIAAIQASASLAARGGHVYH